MFTAVSGTLMILLCLLKSRCAVLLPVLSGVFAAVLFGVLLPGSAVAASTPAATRPELLAPVLHLPLQVATIPPVNKVTDADPTAADPVAFLDWQKQSLLLLNHALLLPNADPMLIAGAEKLNSSADLTMPDIRREHWRLALWQPLDLYLFRPKTPRKTGINAVILLHDHGAEFRIGKDKWLPAAQSPLPDLVRHWQHKYFDDVAVAQLLLQQGYLVLLADAPGFGARGPIQYADQQQLAANLLAQGASLAGLMAREDEAAAQFLAAQPGVTGIAAVGFSLGAFRAWQLAALSEEVDAAAGVGWFNSLQFLRTPQNNFSRGQSAFYLLHPGLYQQLDIPDLVALAAPKPLLLLHGDQDPLMPLSEVNVALAQLQRRYRQCSAMAPQLVVAKGQGHRFGQPLQQQLLQWLADVQLPGAGCSN